jgi:signal transduction histidine kinase/ActR/RegA family two-component response regulator
MDIGTLKAMILSRWREDCRRDPEQGALIHDLDDAKLQDHIPSLSEKIVRHLRGEPIQNLEADAAKHGRQRRALGYTVAAVMRELQILRRVMSGMVENIVRGQAAAEDIQEARETIIDIMDRSTNISVMQYTIAAEEQRNLAEGEARELHQQRDRFLVTLSHELRNQVSPILLSTQLLRDLKPSDDRIRRIVERIERQARHQSVLIDDLLGISRYRYGKLDLKRENLDLSVPIKHALETFQSDLQIKEIRMAVVMPDQPVEVFADKARITQVVINLLSNAIKFTPPGGAIGIKLGEEEGTAVLRLNDNGVGISSEILPQIFGMFFQADEPALAGKAGLGVGLALCKVLVEMHGGTIEARSEGTGNGAEFVVRLPTIARAPLQRVVGPALKVMIVDDNADHLELMADLLALRGYEVVGARDATEALNLVAKYKPNACVIDIGLPEMDGYQLARKLRQIPETRESRLIAVTGYGTQADKSTFEDAGFDHYFPKPPDLEELTRALSKDRGSR